MVTSLDNTFTVLVHEAEEGGYWAEVPEVPGCVSQGDTLDDLNKNIREALEACLEAYAEDHGLDREAIVARWTVQLRHESSA